MRRLGLVMCLLAAALFLVVRSAAAPSLESSAHTCAWGEEATR
jgi:hypothetical protein